MKRAAVIGGGIAGLAAAYELAKSGKWEISLLEASARLGGKILSERSGGLTLEGGPDAFVTNKPEALELARELGLQDELTPTGAKDAGVSVYSRGRLRRFPDGLFLLAPTKILPFLASDIMPWSAKLRMGLEVLIPRADPGIDESIGEFARRRFGEEALETIIAPVLAGIHAGDPDRLSLASTFPQFARMEAESGSLIAALRSKRGGASAPPHMHSKALPDGAQYGGAAAPPPGTGGTTLFMTLRGGLSDLVSALAGRLPPGTARLEAPAARLERGAPGEGLAPGGGYRVALLDGTAVPADAVVLAVPADRAAKLVSFLNPELSALLGEISFASTATVSLAYAAKSFPHPLDSFGFVVDRREGLSVTAATFTSTKFPARVPPGTVLIRCFLGGAGREAALAGSDAELLAAVRADLAGILGVDAEPVTTRVYRWPLANPQYNVGHAERMRRIEGALTDLPGLYLAGSSYRGVGIPDCIRSGREAARRLAGGAAAAVC